MRVLLVQIRDADDPIAEHERQCIGRRLGSVAFTTMNALIEPAKTDWIDAADAMILGGSAEYGVHPENAWMDPLRRLLDAALERDLPSFGICLGHQLFAHHLGAPVRTDDAHAEAGTIDVTLTNAGRADPLFADLDDVVPVHTGHADHVASVPPGVELLATSDRLRTQAFRLRHFYTTQFHPDLSGAEAVTRFSAYRQHRELSPELVDAMTRFRPGADAATLLLGRFVELFG